MTTTAQATAAPTEVLLAGKPFRMVPLRDRDFGELEQWMRSRAIGIAKDAMRDVPDLTPEDRRTLLERAYDTASKLSITTPEGMQLLASIEGATRMIWLSLRREHPDVTVEEVRTMLADPLTLEYAMDKIDEVNRLNDEPATVKKKNRLKRRGWRKQAH